MISIVVLKTIFKYISIVMLSIMFIVSCDVTRKKVERGEILEVAEKIFLLFIFTPLLYIIFS